MNSLGRRFTHGLIAIVFSIFVAVGSATAKNVGDGANATDWEIYSNPGSNFTFKYPKGWEITDDFHYKTHWSVNLQRIGGDDDSENWIRVNSPQFQEEDGVCIQIDQESICT